MLQNGFLSMNNRFSQHLALWTLESRAIFQNIMIFICFIRGGGRRPCQKIFNRAKIFFMNIYIYFDVFFG